ncbi:MAG: putative inorganic carbon transporter subunit DabA [Halomonas sp.]
MTAAAADIETIVTEAHHQALAGAAERIAPLWPLDRWIAVNPWWGLRDLPIEEAEAHLARRAGVTLTQPVAVYRQAWESGRICPEDLQGAITLGESSLDEAALLAYLERPDSAPRRLATAWELADTRGHAAEAIRDPFEPVAELCAAYFDEHQQRWEPDKGTSLYGAWWTGARHDRRLSAAQRQRIETLPAEAPAAQEALLEALALSPEGLEALAHTLLLRVNGWASWCQGLGWHTPDATPQAGIDEFMTMLLAWEWLGLGELQAPQRQRWQAQWEAPPPAARADQAALWCWQHAFELGYQRQLSAALAGRPTRARAPARVHTCAVDLHAGRDHRPGLGLEIAQGQSPPPGAGNGHTLPGGALAPRG